MPLGLIMVTNICVELRINSRRRSQSKFKDLQLAAKKKSYWLWAPLRTYGIAHVFMNPTTCFNGTHDMSVYINRNRYAYIRELWQCDSFSYVQLHFIHQAFFKASPAPVPLICILWAQFAHYKSLILSNCCCHRGWRSDALPPAQALSKHSLSEGGSFTDSVSTVLFCPSSCSSPSLPVTQAARQCRVLSWNSQA